MRSNTVHPFPARMAPHLAYDEMAELPPGRTILDPMAGSGTVLRQAVELGHHALGLDVDPLAVIMARVWTTPIAQATVQAECERLLKIVQHECGARRALPWIDSDKETRDFVNFWFAEPQQSRLRAIAYCLHSNEGPSEPVRNILKLALSRIIVTKDRGASLARDVSHSRPHKVRETNDFDVLVEYRRATERILRALRVDKMKGSAQVATGDARKMCSVPDRSIDLVVTSPPYLNAIDYIRGHRLALVWLGYTVPELRQIRADSIGAERGLPGANAPEVVNRIHDALGMHGELPPRFQRITRRYAADLQKLMAQIERVLAADGKAVLVVGNCYVRGTLVDNAQGVREAGAASGLPLLRTWTRDIPIHHRYLPPPGKADSRLNKRMRQETLLVFGR